MESFCSQQGLIKSFSGVAVVTHIRLSVSELDVMTIAVAKNKPYLKAYFKQMLR